jgi:DNA-binding SARP family transcriptional activator/tetratricopeptide (TPR) repeat protein
MPRSQVEIRLLGGCRLFVNGAECDLRYEKVRILLAWLAMSLGAPQRREKLAALLWPDADEEASRRSLRHALHVLRGALGEAGAAFSTNRQAVHLAAGTFRCDAIALDAAQVRFSGGVACTDDIVELEAATCLYRGEFLAGIELDDDAELSAWLRHQRDAAVLRASNLWRRLLSVRRASGMQLEALDAARRLLELAPLDAQANRACIETLVAVQGEDAALAHYATYEQRLRDECDVSPDAELSQWVARLRHGAAPAETVTERRPIAMLCLQLLDTDPDGESNTRNGLPFSDLLAILRDRLRLRAARLFVPYEGLALVSFGLPISLEESALAAARLAVELSLHGEIGPYVAQSIHCALSIVTVGDRDDVPPSGVTTAALRLCALAGAGEIVASVEAARWLRRDLGRRGGEAFGVTPHPLQPGCFAIRPRVRPTRPSAGDLALPLIGRRTELATLLHGLRASRRAPVSMAVLGEPGIGKTRLAFEVARYAKREGMAIWLRCSRETQGEPLAPLLGWLAALAHLGTGERSVRAQRRLARLDRLWDTHGLMTELFSPDVAPADAGVPATPASLRGRFARLFHLAERAARGRSLFVVVDDLQWADRTTRALLDQWLQAVHGRVFTLLLARESADIPPKVPTLTLARLADRDARTLLSLVQPEERAARADVDAGVQLADGLPLFLVELKRHWPTLQLPEQDLPRNVYDLLGVRLDSLSPRLRRLACRAAVLGNEGEIDVLARFVDEPLARLSPQLVRFVDAGLMYPPAHGRYRFRHQALHRAALERLPLKDQRTWHARAAGLLADCLPAARIALHWERANRLAEAVATYLNAGRQAFALGAHRDAVRHFQRVLDLAPGCEADARTTASGWIGKGLALIELDGYGSMAARVCFDEARKLAQASGEPDIQLQARWGTWLPSSSQSGHHGALRDQGRPLLALAIAHGDDAWVASGHQAVGNSLYFLGRFDEAECHLRVAAELGARPGVRERMLAQIGQASDVYALGFLSWIAVKRGDMAAAEGATIRSLTAARALNSPSTTAFALAFAARAAQMADQPRKALQWTARLREVAEPHGFDLWIALAVMIDNWAHVRLGKTFDVSALEAAVEAVNVAMPSVAALFLIPYMETLTHLARYDDALRTFDTALAIARRYRDRQALDILWALRARCLDAMGGRSAEAARSSRRAERLRRCLIGKTAGSIDEDAPPIELMRA